MHSEAKKRITQQLAALFMLAFALTTRAGGDSPHWTYEGNHGPQYWGDLSPDYIQCKVGLSQSPVDIVNSMEADLPPLLLDYPGYSTEVINTGHTAQVNVTPGNTLRVDGDVFELQQFHFHAPSEHRMAGKAFMMELHLVHANSRGELAVIGVLYEEGPSSPSLRKLGSKIPTELNRPEPLSLPLSDLTPPAELRDYYRYSGSLTTPPCSEGVRWFVAKKHRKISSQRTQAYIELIGEDARGPQSINARVILE